MCILDLLFKWTEKNISKILALITDVPFVQRQTYLTLNISLFGNVELSDIFAVFSSLALSLRPSQ